MIFKCESYIFLLILITLNPVYSQTSSPRFSIVKVLSSNLLYSLDSQPFDNILQSKIGISTVSNSKGEVLYQIDQYFDFRLRNRYVLLSDDGRIIVSIRDKTEYFREKKIDVLEIFKDGELKFELSITELTGCEDNKMKCDLFYKEPIDSVRWINDKYKVFYNENSSDLEKQLSQYPVILKDDVLDIHTSNGNVLKVDIRNGVIQGVRPGIEDSKILPSDTIVNLLTIVDKFNTYWLPTISQKKFDKKLAKYMDMKVYPEYSKKAFKFLAYRDNISILIDRDGAGELIYDDDLDDLDVNMIRNFVSSNTYDIDGFPDIVDKWIYDGYVALMNKSKKKSKLEKKKRLLKEKEQLQIDLTADSIKGVYIPVDLEDCMRNLDNILPERIISEFKELNSKEETIKYHLGLGMWLRNNWGLWRGSRLRTYFIDEGILHPEEMSSLIMKEYYLWLLE